MSNWLITRVGTLALHLPQFHSEVKLLKRIETEGEDGYTVVSDFISSYDGCVVYL